MRPCGWVFRVPRRDDCAKHVGLESGDANPKGVGSPKGDGTPYTFESGDGHGHSAFHTDQRWHDRCSKYYRIRYGRPPWDVGDLTPVGGLPDVPNWPVLGCGYLRYGKEIRMLKGLLGWIAPEVKLSTRNTPAGKSFGKKTLAGVRLAEQR